MPYPETAAAVAAAAGGVAVLLAWAWRAHCLPRPHVPAGHWVRGARGTVVGHRGCRTAQHPTGNTLGSFAEGAAAAVAVELDVQITADGELVVFHDDRTGKLLSGRDTAVRDTTLADMQSRRFLAEPDRHQAPPTLREVIALAIQHNANIVVELKGLGHSYGRRLAAAVSTLLNDEKWVPHCAVISFNPSAVYAARQGMPDIPTALIVKRGLLADVLGKSTASLPGIAFMAWAVEETYLGLALGVPVLPALLGSTGLCANQDLWTQELVESASRAGLHTNAWTVNTPESAKRLQGIGVDLLTTDFPREILR